MRAEERQLRWGRRNALQDDVQERVDVFARLVEGTHRNTVLSNCVYGCKVELLLIRTQLKEEL